MAQFNTLPIHEAKVSALPPRRMVQETYRGYISQLIDNPEQAGQIHLEQGDLPITERARLKNAAKAEGVQLTIQRRGESVFFWLNDHANGTMDLTLEDVADEDMEPSQPTQPATMVHEPPTQPTRQPTRQPVGASTSTGGGNGRNASQRGRQAARR